MKLESVLENLLKDAEKEKETVKLKRAVVEVTEQVSSMLKGYVLTPVGYVSLTEEGRLQHLMLQDEPAEKEFEQYLNGTRTINFSRSTS